MEIDFEGTINLDQVAYAISSQHRHNQIDALILLLRSVDTETARRAIARWEES